MNIFFVFGVLFFLAYLKFFDEAATPKRLYW